MELSVRESASLLNVSEKTIYRWIKQGVLPAYRVHDQYRFHRAELLDWAAARRLNVPVEVFSLGVPQPPSLAVRLANVMAAGGVYHGVGGADRAAALRGVVELLPLPPAADREFLWQMLLTRESLGSTAIGEGIALPHVRNPVVVSVPEPMIALCFLQQPVPYDAIDGQPVHTLFTLLSPTVRAHLQMLARLSYALRQKAFADAIARRGTRDEILQACAQVDQGIPTSPSDA